MSSFWSPSPYGYAASPTVKKASIKTSNTPENILSLKFPVLKFSGKKENDRSKVLAY